MPLKELPLEQILLIYPNNLLKRVVFKNALLPFPIEEGSRALFYSYRSRENDIFNVTRYLVTLSPSTMTL